jgi:hypothetical protein
VPLCTAGCSADCACGQMRCRPTPAGQQRKVTTALRWTNMHCLIDTCTCRNLHALTTGRRSTRHPNSTHTSPFALLYCERTALTSHRHRPAPQCSMLLLSLRLHCMIFTISSSPANASASTAAAAAVARRVLLLL